MPRFRVSCPSGSNPESSTVHAGYAAIRFSSIMNGRTNNSGGCRPPQPRIIESKLKGSPEIGSLSFLLKPCVHCGFSLDGDGRYGHGGREVSRQRQRDSQRTAMALPRWLSYRETLLQAQRPIDIPFGQRTATVFHSVVSCLRRSGVYRAKIASVAVSNHSHAPERVPTMHQSGPIGASQNPALLCTDRASG